MSASDDTVPAARHFSTRKAAHSFTRRFLLVIRNVWRWFCGAWLLAGASPVLADIYYFIDENGRSHFSDVRIDERYQLYMKERPRAESPRVEASRTETASSAVGLPELREPPMATLADVRKVPAK